MALLQASCLTIRETIEVMEGLSQGPMKLPNPSTPTVFNLDLVKGLAWANTMLAALAVGVNLDGLASHGAQGSASFAEVNGNTPLSAEFDAFLKKSLISGVYSSELAELHTSVTAAQTWALSVWDAIDGALLKGVLPEDGIPYSPVQVGIVLEWDAGGYLINGGTYPATSDVPLVLASVVADQFGGGGVEKYLMATDANGAAKFNFKASPSGPFKVVHIVHAGGTSTTYFIVGSSSGGKG